MLPLKNIKVIELAGLAPVPLCGMILSDYGAKVIRVENLKTQKFMTDEVLNRGKLSISLNLKKPGEVNILRRLLQSSDILLDPYRPGVLERLCLSPTELQRENPRLIIARLSGYGQPRPGDRPEVMKLKNSAGHDINYLAMSGVLSRLGPSDMPLPPINMLADFGAGAMSLVNGILMALLSRASSGHGEVVDCSITLSTAYLCSFLWRSRDKLSFLWPNPQTRCGNVLDGGAPFYRCYKTSDDKFLAVAALEPQFYSSLLRLLSVPEDEAPQYSVSLWPTITQRFSEIFSTRTAQEWTEEAEECCLSPVLDLDEAAHFWRDEFLCVDGHEEPGPQPRLSHSNTPPTSRPKVGEDTEAVLRDLGCTDHEIRDVIDRVSAKL